MYSFFNAISQSNLMYYFQRSPQQSLSTTVFLPNQLLILFVSFTQRFFNHNLRLCNDIRSLCSLIRWLLNCCCRLRARSFLSFIAMSYLASFFSFGGRGGCSCFTGCRFFS